MFYFNFTETYPLRPHRDRAQRRTGRAMSQAFEVVLDTCGYPAGAGPDARLGRMWARWQIQDTQRIAPARNIKTIDYLKIDAQGVDLDLRAVWAGEDDDHARVAGHAEVGREWPICCGSTPPHWSPTRGKNIDRVPAAGMWNSKCAAPGAENRPGRCKDLNGCQACSGRSLKKLMPASQAWISNSLNR